MIIISNDIVIDVENFMKIILNSEFQLLWEYNNVEQIEVANYLRIIFDNTPIKILEIKLNKNNSLKIVYQNDNTRKKHSFDYNFS